MRFETAPFWSLALLETEKATDAGLPVALEAVESGTGRLLDGVEIEPGEGKRFLPGDTLFGKLRPYLAKSWLADQEGVALGDIHVYRPREGVDPRFVSYVVQSDNFVSLATASSTGAKMPRVEWSKVAQFPVPSPPLEEQKAIADYLDREVGELDEMLTELRHAGMLLQQRREAIVGGLVRGREGDEMVELHVLASIQSGENIPADTITEVGKYPVYGGNGIRGFRDDFNVEEDRVLVGRQGALCGNVHHARGPFFATEHALVVSPYSPMDTRWLAAVLADQDLGQLSMASAQPGITAGAVGLQRIPLIGLEEQTRLADELEVNVAGIDSMLEELSQLQKFLFERRATLIQNAINGTIEVNTYA
ncbi:hypothetical protein EKI51_08405 [Corynebacterium sanguinis]|uniref:restriction endonuclease subunit S n=1 Tax=Corynebacterium sanguinis TaxID=2594913 RepID=UPI0011A3D9B3|nr:restriction endonuclease subunit S [Corynebacterium sanguinis]TVS23111.1 hypothetical protein EKI51_08405 [Corynebacterium sanguinis]